MRLRLPGGRVPARTLRRLTEVATAYGNGVLQLTSRGGVQVRGLPDPLPAGFLAAVTEIGLLPTTTHERVRNIVASPLTGLVGGLADLSSLTCALDAALVAAPALAELPGRFLFVLDDGRGDVVDLRFDLGYRATGPDEGWVLVGGPEQGRPVTTADAVPTLIGLAHAFAEARTATGVWHVAELPCWVDSLDLAPVPPVPGRLGLPLGVVGDAASVSVPLAMLSARQTAAVEAIAEDGFVVVTPWRGLVVPGAADRIDELVAAGLVADDQAAWALLSACVGAPHCGKARIDTTAVATALAGSGSVLPRTHLSGCERRCGAPADDHLELVAPTIEDALLAVREPLAVGGSR